MDSLTGSNRNIRKTAAQLRVFYGTLTGGMALLVIARNAILFLFGWEIMALSAYFLVTTEGHKSEVRESGWIYLVASHVAALCLIALFALLHCGQRFVCAGAVGSEQPGTRDGDGDLCSGTDRVRPEGRHHATARLAAKRPRHRAQPRLGHHVGRDDQDGHLWAGSDHVAGFRIHHWNGAA